MIRGVTIESVDESTRLRLSDDPAEYHRAAHEDAPLAVWNEIVEARPDLRTWVAHNKTVPMEVLERLARDAAPEVRCAVASKRKLSSELFETLAQDVDASVRHLIACNAKTPRVLLDQLAADPESFVAETARTRLQERFR
jgi:hypothetical protein